MKFECPQCGQHLEGEQELAGREIPCPTCAHSFTIPSRAESSGSPPTRSRTRMSWMLVAAGLITAGAVASTFAFTGKSGTADWFKKLPIAEVRVYPPDVFLTTKQDHQSIVVQAVLEDGVTLDVTDKARFTFADKSVARLEKGVIRSVADGKTHLQINYGGKVLKVPITVRQAAMERPISFKLDVMPVLMKAGCNSGACHGSSRGKDGFHLSLFGYDPDGDYFRLTKESIGRRINLALPTESLVLEKGTGHVPHTGGERFTTNSPLYRTLQEWLMVGAPKDDTNVARVVSIELMPRQMVLEGSGATQKLTVRAKYSDGTDRDITSLAVFISNNEVAAKASEAGVVTAGQRGEAFVMARFSTFTVGAQVLVIPSGLKFEFPQVAENNFIDTQVNAKLKKLRFAPSDVCDDATFLRRVYLDIIGLMPPADKVREFVASPDKDKRNRVIDELLNRKEFADLWVMKWAELLGIRSNNDQFSYKSALLYYEWLQDRITRNVPINVIVQDLLTASGSNFKNPAASYYQIERETLKTAENAAQVFMGMRIQCAQCHNHPFDRWTMDDYYSFSAFFTQIGRKNGEDPREAVVFDKKEGEMKHPVGGRVMKPKFLGGVEPEIGKDDNRREVLARWLASPQNPYFARNMANIIWSHFLGKGIIEPVDDIRVSNPPSNPELLDALAAKLTGYNYDFKQLIRDICNSRTYQLSTRANATNALDERNFSRATIRRLRAEVLLDCINEVTESQDKFQGLPKGARAVQIADGNVNTYFLTTFGRATRATVCSCEVKTEPNLSQALHLLNGSTTQDKIANGGLTKRLLREQKAPDEIIDQLYLRCLARPPTAGEKSKLTAYLKEPAQNEQVLNDVFWSLLNAKEFIFNH